MLIPGRLSIFPMTGTLLKKFITTGKKPLKMTTVITSVLIKQKNVCLHHTFSTEKFRYVYTASCMLIKNLFSRNECGAAFLPTRTLCGRILTP